jgi:hypothetical protein
LDNMVQILTEVIEATAVTVAKEEETENTDTSVVTNGIQKSELLETWLSRDFLGTIESDKERFLTLAVPCMNCFKAQHFLGLVSFLECLSWYAEPVSVICQRHPLIDPATIECVRFSLAPL